MNATVGHREVIERIPINTRVPSHIRLVNASLHENPNSPSAIIAQGMLDSSTLRFLKVDDYQRPLEQREDIWSALKGQTPVPAIEIGIRGTDYESEGADMVIRSPAYIIDGWQRVGNAMRLMDMIPDHPVSLLATIHFGTTYAWEENRFTDLNKNTRKVSPNQHLRNMRDKNDAVMTLHSLSTAAPGFPLYKKVCWSQNMARAELVSALVLSKSAMILHGHKISMQAGRTDNIASAIANAYNTVGAATFKHNMMTFYSVIDECWPIHLVQYRHTATQIKSSFLYEVARMFSRHPAFWEGLSQNTLFVPADDRRKLAKFPITDKQVVGLAGSPGAGRKILYQLLVDHMNSGRRTQKLVAR